MPYACVSEDQPRTRCRTILPDGKGRVCDSHKPKQDGEKVAFAPPPDRVFIRLPVNTGDAKKLVEAGVPEEFPDFQAQDAQHAARARELERDPYAYRKGVPDTGVPVFGPGGVSSVSLFPLVGELRGSGYGMEKFHLQPARRGDGSIFVLWFKVGVSKPLQVPIFVLELLGRNWEQVRVWANPPDEDSVVSHTVNPFRSSQDKPATQLLQFQKGLWGIARRSFRPS